MRRDALAEVLAVMTSEPDALWWRMMTTDHETRAVLAGIEWRIAGEWSPLRLWRREPETQRSPLRMTTPAEAVEALATAGMWPWEIGAERAPRWWCYRCEGGGSLNDGPGWPGLILCPACSTHSATDELRIGTTADPPSLAALVAVASLGRPLLQRITHTLVPWIARAAGCPDARVVWRVMSRDGLREHRDRQRVRGSDEWLVDAFSTEMGHAADRNGESAWPRECPWPALRPTHRVHRAWPALRTLAVGDGATPQPTGVHLVGLSRDRITLAVEAI